MPHAAVQALLDAFAAKAGVGPIRLNEDGWATIGLDDLAVHLEAPEGAEMLGFNAWLGEAPEEKRVAIATAIADANYLLAATQGATIGMNRRTGDVVIAVQVPADWLTLVRFERILENFATVALAFRGRLLAEAPAAAPPAMPAGGFGLRA